MSQHRHKRQNRSRASVSVSFGGSGFNPGSQQFTVGSGGSGAPGGPDDFAPHYGRNPAPTQAPANASIAFPGAYPFASSGGGFIATGNSVDGGHPTRPVIANRRTRYGGGRDRSLGLGHPSRHSINMDPPPHVSMSMANGGPPHFSGRPGDSHGGPHRPPPLALPSRFTNGVGAGPSSPLAPQRPGTPQSAMLPYNDRSWTIDHATRQSLSHFPHSSLSLPLTTSPLPRHTPHSSVNFSAGPSGLGIATAPPGHPARRAVTHASMLSQQAHGRVPSIPQRTGPPPKAILGGPGGKTFDELRVGPPVASRSASTSMEPSPSVSARSMSPLSSPAKPTFADQYQTKYLGTTVRVALPPESYSPPDSPPPETAGDEDDNDENLVRKVVRRETYPWPAGLVHGLPQDIPLPPSPTEEELNTVDNDMVSPVPIDHTPHGSLSAPIWEGKQVLVSVPMLPLKPPTPEGDEVASTTYETAADSTPAETAYEFRSKAASDDGDQADHGVPNGNDRTHHARLSAQTVTLGDGDGSGGPPSASKPSFDNAIDPALLKRSLGEVVRDDRHSQPPPSSPQRRPTDLTYNPLAKPFEPEAARPKTTLRPTAPAFVFLRPTSAPFVPSAFKPAANNDTLGAPSEAPDGPEPFLSPAPMFLTTSPESTTDELGEDSDLINLQATPHVPIPPHMPHGTPHFYPTVPSPAFMARTLETPRRFKPTIFTPRDQPSGPSTPQSQVGLLSHSEHDSNPHVFKFVENSGAPSIPSIAGSPFTFTMPPSTVTTPLPAPPQSIVEQPHTASTVKSASITSVPGGSSTDGGGGALGLFTFNYKLRPQATEFKPMTPSLGSPSKALALQPTTPAPIFASLSTRPSTLPLGANTPSRPSYAPLGSAFGPLGSGFGFSPGTPAIINSSLGFGEDSSDASRPSLDEYTQPRRPIPILAPQIQPNAINPWRNAVPSPTEAGSFVESHLSEDNRSVDEERDVPRSRTVTAKRSSQNSHLPRSWAETARSQPSSPIKDPTSTVFIHPSLPLMSQHSVAAPSRRSSVFAPETPANPAKQALGVPSSPRMPESTDSFMSMVPLPSEHEHETNVPSAVLKKSMERRQSAPAPVKTDSKPLSFASKTYTPPPHPPPKQLESPQRFFEGLRRHNRLSPIPAPKLPLNGEDGEKFRTWTFPTPSHKRRFSGLDNGDERELPDIQASPQRNPAAPGATLLPAWGAGDVPRPVVAQPSPDPFVPRQVEQKGWDSPQRLLPPTVLPPFLPSPQTFPLSVNGGQFGVAADLQNPIRDVVKLLKTIEDQMNLVKMDTSQLVFLSDKSANESFHRSNGAQEAVHAIKAHLPSPQAIDNVTGMLETQNGILQDIVRRIEEETTPSPTQFESSDHTQEMFRAIISGQHAMMAKFSELTETQNAIEDLRGATDALLESKSDWRDAAVDHRRASQIVDLQTQIRDEVTKTHRAERDAAILSIRVDELNKHAKDKELDDVWRALIRADVAAVTASLSKVARSQDKAQDDLDEMREQLLAQSTLAQSVVDAQRTERDTKNQLAAERHAQLVGLQNDAAVFDQKLFDLLGGLGQAVSRNRDDKVQELEQEVKSLRSELQDVSNVKNDLRVQVAEALGNVQLEKEKAQRFAESEAGERRTLDLQLKAEKARTSFLESRIQKLEAQLQDTNHNLDVWRSAALEQRLHAERTSAHVSALQSENYHWREFAISADRDRLDQWLSTKPFHGIAPQHTGGGSPKTVRAGTPVMSPKTVSSKTVQLPRTPGRSVLALTTAATPPPVRRAIPTIVEPTAE